MPSSPSSSTSSITTRLYAGPGFVVAGENGLYLKLRRLPGAVPQAIAPTADRCAVLQAVFQNREAA